MNPILFYEYENSAPVQGKIIRKSLSEVSNHDDLATLSISVAPGSAPRLLDGVPLNSNDDPNGPHYRIPSIDAKGLQLEVNGCIDPLVNRDNVDITCQLISLMDDRGLILDSAARNVIVVVDLGQNQMSLAIYLVGPDPRRVISLTTAGHDGFVVGGSGDFQPWQNGFGMHRLILGLESTVPLIRSLIETAAL